ncbi:MAG: N-acetylglucosamine-6-phosphate deacetylase [Geminocystis sp.]|nr:N-acetylglucosamine-6-phosphate deacetylase [Geminocystis sp.]HIK37678.1 N-acetylglucosamine-6-phosphate deacetylase [Geminocystis sp. M7585_C2015_104]
MTVNIFLKNARLIGHSGLHTLVVEDGCITAITDTHPPDALDMEGDYLSLGGVDLQINGALGLAFTELREENLEKLHEICRYLWQTGVDQFLPTIITTSVDKIHQSLEAIRKFKRQPPQQKEAEILGVHLEGPFLNYEKRGAHPAEYLLPLTLENVKTVLAEYAELVKIITLAPELESTGTIIPYLRSLGITVSLGHSQATAQEAHRAFQQGATMVTHAFNAMPSLHHREGGLLAEAIVNPEVYCGLIADGIHVSQIMITILLRASNFDKGVFLVSDALSPLGLGDGVYPWEGRTIEVKSFTARLPDGTLAGTTLPLLKGAENLFAWGICDLQQAISLATVSPRKAIGLPVSLLGAPAVNLLRWRGDETSKTLSWQRVFGASGSGGACPDP